jgi:hypothetical protein
MLGMMYGGNYGELNDYEAPPMPRAGRRSSFERSGRASELSLDLGDLQDLRENYSRNFSELSLASWQDEGGTCSLDQASCADLNEVGPISRYGTLESVLESSDCTHYSRRRLSGSLDLDDIPEQPQEDSCTTFTNQLGSSTFRGMQRDLNDDNDNDDSKVCFDRSSVCSHKRVHFAGSTSLEDVHEFEKPDKEDYHLLYYMAQDLQKMMDDFKAEENLERSVVR